MSTDETMLVKLESNFKCGGCSMCFEYISLLHFHLIDHPEGGSYKYNHTTLTAYPVSVSVDVSTQTCSSDLIPTEHGSITPAQTLTSDETDNEANNAIGTAQRHSFVDADNLTHDFDSNIQKDIKKEVDVSENIDSSSEAELNLEYHIKQDVDTCISMNIDSSETVSENCEIECSRTNNGDMCSTDVSTYQALDSSKTNSSLLCSMWKTPMSDILVAICKQHISSKSGGALETVTTSIQGLNKKALDLERSKASLCNVDCQGGEARELSPGLMNDTCFKRQSDMKMNIIDNQSLIGGNQSNKTFITGKRQHVSPRIESGQQKVEQRSVTKTGRVGVGKSRVKCDLCNKFLTNIRRHQVLVHNMPGTRPLNHPKDSSPVYKCELCGKIVYKWTRSKHNKRHHSGKLTGPFICEICGEVYQNIAGLNTHKRKHTDYFIRCNKCNFIAKSPEALKLHKMKHTPTVKHFKYVCKVCGKAFSGSQNLAVHVRNVHMGEKPFKCDICGKEFFRSRYMESHRRIHFDVTIPCSFCGRGFKDVSSLKRHTQIHTGEKNFVCHICNHGYITKGQYWNHMAKKHSLSKSEASALRQEMIAAENEKQEKEQVKYKETAGI